MRGGFPRSFRCNINAVIEAGLIHLPLSLQKPSNLQQVRGLSYSKITIDTDKLCNRSVSVRFFLCIVAILKERQTIQVVRDTAARKERLKINSYRRHNRTQGVVKLA
jgi:hypothetical protein